MKLHLVSFFCCAIFSSLIAQPSNPFGGSSQQANSIGAAQPAFKLMKTTDAEFDLAKIGGLGRSETSAMAEKIWKQFRSVHDFDGSGTFTESEAGNCPDTPAARLAFSHHVKSAKPLVVLVDLQSCPRPGCKKGMVEVISNGFASTMPCTLCEGAGKLGNVYNFKLVCSAELKPLASPSKAEVATAPSALSPLATFCSSNVFMPTRRPNMNGSEVILGRVGLEYSSAGVVFAMKIIDTSDARGGSSYYATVKLLDADAVTLAELTQVYLPVRGGVLKIPLAKFSPRRGQVVGASTEAQLSILKSTYGIKVAPDVFVGGEGLITPSTSVLGPIVNAPK